MKSGRPLEGQQWELLQDAAAWRLLALLFECPSPSWRKQVRALASEVAAPELRAAARAALKQAGLGWYHATFGPGGPAPSREAACRSSLELGTLIADLAAFYEAFHYEPATREPPDHITVEAGFLAYLRFKQAYALARGDPEAAALTALAAQRFLAEHLRVLAGPLAAVLLSSPVSYLRLAGQELQRRTGAQADPGPCRSPFPILEPPTECGCPD